MPVNLSHNNTVQRSVVENVWPTETNASGWNPEARGHRRVSSTSHMAVQSLTGYFISDCFVHLGGNWAACCNHKNRSRVERAWWCNEVSKRKLEEGDIILLSKVQYPRTGHLLKSHSWQHINCCWMYSVYASLAVATISLVAQLAPQLAELLHYRSFGPLGERGIQAQG